MQYQRLVPQLVEMDSTISLPIVYRYDNTTGIFTVPPGGDGFYYFSVFLMVVGAESSLFDVEHNGQLICTVYSDLTESPASDWEVTSCNAITNAVEGVCNKPVLKFN